MALHHWLFLGVGLVVHAGTLTAFFYREFATKRDMRQLELHLREIFGKDIKTLADKLDNLHADIRDIKHFVSKSTL